MLHIIGIIISLFLSVLLFTKKGRSKADLILAVWLFVICIHLILYHLDITRLYVQFPYFLGFEIAMPLLHGPFLFFYTVALTGGEIRKITFFLHFLPLIAAYALLLEFLLLPIERKIEIYKTGGAGYENIIMCIYGAILLSGVLYVVASYVLLRRYTKYISDQFSYLEKISLRWLKYLIIGVGAIWLSVFFGNDISTFTLLDLFILFVGYFGVKQVGLFTNSNISDHIRSETEKGANMGLEEEEPQSDINTEKIKYQKSTAGEALLLKIHQDMVLLMQTEKLYKAPELSLDDLSQRLNVNTNLLSQVINSLENKNFFDYINEQRIEEFKEIVLLPENRKFTLLALAYEVGFNSKSSFNRNFKKTVGLAPTAYLKQQKIQLESNE